MKFFSGMAATQTSDVRKNLIYVEICDKYKLLYIFTSNKNQNICLFNKLKKLFPSSNWSEISEDFDAVFGYFLLIEVKSCSLTRWAKCNIQEDLEVPSSSPDIYILFLSTYQSTSTNWGSQLSRPSLNNVTNRISPISAARKNNFNFKT